ncbi:protein lifeguard 1-like [Chironomus tepperi]|uniref:protein lifeguard 1-like n=1 Tax=Chironomus tepperi TaxID=113505 RepID=UPI00391F60C0
MTSKYDQRPYGFGSSSDNSNQWNNYKTQDDFVPNFGFSKSSIRNGFIQKVFSIVSAQLTFTVAMIALFQFHEGALSFAYRNTWMLNVAMFSTLGLSLLMSFSTSIRRTAPLNLIILGSYTVCQGFLVALISSFYEVEEVFYAVGLTAAIVFGLATYASMTKEDFTMKGGMFASALMALMLGSLVSIFYRGEFFSFMLSVAGAAIFSMYIIYDLQLIMGDKSLSISPEEYIFASLNLYVDIMRIFLELLKILRYLNENSNQNQREKKRRN